MFGHGDVGPWNIVARNGLPIAFIDWEFAARSTGSTRLRTLVGSMPNSTATTSRPSTNCHQPKRRARQLRLFVDAYGLSTGERAGLVTKMIDFAVRDAANEIDMDGGLKMAKRPTGPSDPGWGPAWRIRAAAWLVEHRGLLEAALH